MSAAPTVAVTVEPLGATVLVEPGETLMAAALRTGLHWPTLCRGNAMCGYCHAEIVSTETPLPAVQTKELRGLEQSLPGPGNRPRRLACQLRPTAPLTVFRIGVRGPAAKA